MNGVTLLILCVLWILSNIYVLSIIKYDIDDKNLKFGSLLSLKVFIKTLFKERNIFGIVLSMVVFIISIPAMFFILILQISFWVIYLIICIWNLINYIWNLGNKKQ